MATDAEIRANQAAFDKDKAATAKADKAAQAKEDEFHANKGASAEGLVGESGDPDVHYLIAVRDGLQQNRDAIDPPPSDASDAEVAGIDEKIAEVNKKLNELGYKAP